MRYITRTLNDTMVIERNEPEDYVTQLLYKAFKDGVNIKVLYNDGSSFEFNPKE